MDRLPVTDYKILEIEYGTMYHLLINRCGSDNGIKFVSDFNYPVYTSINSYPVFFDKNKVFCLAVEYTIIYPKIYIKRSVPLFDIDLPIQRSFLQ